MNILTIAVTGGRDHFPTTAELDELTAVVRSIRESYNFTGTRFVHGAARGVDTVVGAWAKSQGFIVKPYPISLSLDGELINSQYSPRLSGVNRNERMLTDARPDALIAFPGGTGTEDCIKRAKRKGIKVYYVGY